MYGVGNLYYFLDQKKKVDRKEDSVCFIEDLLYSYVIRGKEMLRSSYSMSETRCVPYIQFLYM